MELDAQQRRRLVLLDEAADDLDTAAAREQLARDAEVLAKAARPLVAEEDHAVSVLREVLAVGQQDYADAALAADPPLLRCAALRACLGGAAPSDWPAWSGAAAAWAVRPRLTLRVHDGEAGEGLGLHAMARAHRRALSLGLPGALRYWASLRAAQACDPAGGPFAPIAVREPPDDRSRGAASAPRAPAPPLAENPFANLLGGMAPPPAPQPPAPQPPVNVAALLIKDAFRCDILPPHVAVAVEPAGDRGLDLAAQAEAAFDLDRVGLRLLAADGGPPTDRARKQWDDARNEWASDARLWARAQMHNLLRMFHYFDAHQAVVRSEGVPVYDPRHTEVAAWCIAAPRLEPLSKVTFGAVPERPSPLRDEVVIGALTRREEGDAGTRPGARSIVAMVGIDDVLDVLLPELLDYTGKDADMPRGALLHGPPGTGKTHAMRGLCASLGIQLVCEPLSAADFARGYVGENAGMVRALANRAGLVPWRVCAAAIDEIDGIAPVGDKAEGSKNDLRGVLLSQIGGVQDVPNFIVIGGTNYLDRMDPAFRRRASTQVYMGRPDTAGRRAWINLQLGGQNGVLQRYAPDAEPREQLLSDAVAWTLGFSHDHMRRASNRLRLTLAQIAGAEERIARRVCRTLELPHPATQQMLRGPHSAVGLRSVLRAALAAFARAERVLVAGEVVPRMYPAEGALARAGEDLVRELGAHFRGTGTPLTGRIVLDCTGLRRNGDRPCIWARIERTGGVGEVRAALARARELQGKPVWGSDELSDAWTLLADSQLWERIGEEVGPLDVRVQGIFGAGIAVAGPLEQPVVGVPYHAFGVVADDDRVLVRRVGTGWQRPGENGGAAWVPFQPNAADRRALRRAEEKAGVFLRLARFSSFAALNTAQIAARVGQIHQQRLAGRGVPADRARQVDNLTPSEKDSLYEETWFNSRQWVPDPVFAEHEVADIRGHVVDRVCDLLEILLEHLQDRNLDSDPPPRSTLDLALPVDPASGAAARFAAQTLLRACIEAPAGHFALLDRMSAGSGEDAAVAAAVNDAFAERLKIRSSVTLVDLNGLVQLHERPGESRPVTSAAVGPLTATYEAPNVTYEIRRQATMDAVVESMNEALDASSRAPGRFRHIYCVSVQHPYLLHVLSRRIFWPASEADEEEERIRKSKADMHPCVRCGKFFADRDNRDGACSITDHPMGCVLVNPGFKIELGPPRRQDPANARRDEVASLADLFGRNGRLNGTVLWVSDNAERLPAAQEVCRRLFARHAGHDENINEKINLHHAGTSSQMFHLFRTLGAGWQVVWLDGSNPVGLDQSGVVPAAHVTIEEHPHVPQCMIDGPGADL